MKRTITKRSVTLKKDTLIKARKKLLLTQRELGELVGSPYQMTGWRAENQPIDMATARKIAKVLNIPYSKLVDETHSA